MTYQPTHSELLAALSPDFLEKNPKGFLENLKLCVKNKIDITEYTDNTTYESTWYSPLPMCLVYLVGDLENSFEKQKYDFYGREVKINEELGIEIMKYLYLNGANLTIKDYYDEDIYDFIDKYESGKYILTRRINNKKFINFLKELLE